MITSKQNQQVKFVCSLKQKKYRDQFGVYVVEGEKMVKEAIEFSKPVESIFVTEKYENLFDNFENLIVVSDEVFKAMSDEVTPQGILAVVKIEDVEIKDDLSRCILLDRVQDPGNVGTIMRLATACGIKDVFLIDSADPYSQKAVRASMSGIYHVNIKKVTSEQIVDILNNRNIPLICADMDGENIFSFKTPSSFCLCVGNEGQGISDYLMEKASYTISIPMEKGIESLNVSVACGVTLYTLLNRN